MHNSYEIHPSKSGTPTLRWQKIYLHSRYDPNLEAEKLIAQQNFAHKSVLFLINPGLGYLNQVAIRFFPHLHIYQLYSSFPAWSEHLLAPVAWSPASTDNLEEFVTAAISPYAPEDIAVLSWAPGCNADPGASTALVKKLSDILLRQHSDINTGRYFFKPWLRNCVRNCLFRSCSPLPSTVTVPVLIAASGPSLQQYYSLLQQYAPYCLVIALPSSIRALDAAAIPYDYVIQTDGGFWAKAHYPAHKSGIRTIGALRAALPQSNVDLSSYHPFAVSHVEQFIWTLLFKQPLPFLPDSPTVASQALDLAMMLSSGPCIVFGLDLANKDQQAHIRPHSFDYFDTIQASRLSPFASNHYLSSFAQSTQVLASNPEFTCTRQQRFFRIAITHHREVSRKIWQLGPQGTTIFPPPPENFFSSLTKPKLLTPPVLASSPSLNSPEKLAAELRLSLRAILSRLNQEHQQLADPYRNLVKELPSALINDTTLQVALPNSAHEVTMFRLLILTILDILADPPYA
jgi:hypothetical protein